MGKRRMFTSGLLIGIAGVFPCLAKADTTATFQVSATVVSGCEINGALMSGGENLGEYGAVNFGSHSSLSKETVTAVLEQNVGLTLSCTPGVSLNMALGSGLHATTSRNMRATGSASYIPYQLYRDAGFSQAIPIDQVIPVAFSNPSAITLPIYGRLVLNGDKPPDIYSDTLLLTLSW